MRPLIRRVVAILGVAGVLAASAAHADGASAKLIARGAYLAKAADCIGCHTAAPKNDGPDPKPFAGGLPIAAPFGTIYSSNITPDAKFGIGGYRFEDFARALRDGIAPGGKRLYPAMPYPSFSKIDDEDMRALYAYFMHGVEPVAVAAPATHLPFPYDQRWALAFWNMAFAPTGRFQPNPARDAQWNRGAYLVQSLGHCGACHTPRGAAYNETGYTETSGTYLTGGTLDHWYAPPLTALDGAGLGRLSAQDIASFLKIGHGGGAIAFGSMAQVVEDSTQYLTDPDLTAIATYLKSLPATDQGGKFDPNATTARLKTGEQKRPGASIYANACARCHQSDGAGAPMKYPRLAGNPAVLADNADSLIRLLIQGGHAPSTVYGPLPKEMPAFGKKLTDAEIANVLSFVRGAWGNDAKPVSPRDVRAVRDALASH
ncbi:putative diheme cytochrome c-553 [Candidatus Burkholderia verschuerenii]|uniref:Putative diheme cytochrome c-553 n=1 Tax=Candidatus Burkholderia verschuerenii TaxID=242163 RepID=A0A0L0MFS1_9BURK|nr:cytochrome c [Candidatus Burkholderia verschuerenii]KND61120.1 putative diheme cytochrome c-553 [Candidatus Burkholderia verschuerenii]